MELVITSIATQEIFNTGLYAMTTLILLLAFIDFQLREIRAAGKGNALCLVHARDNKRRMPFRERGYKSFY